MAWNKLHPGSYLREEERHGTAFEDPGNSEYCFWWTGHLRGAGHFACLRYSGRIGRCRRRPGRRRDTLYSWSGWRLHLLFSSHFFGAGVSRWHRTSEIPGMGTNLDDRRVRAAPDQHSLRDGPRSLWTVGHVQGRNGQSDQGKDPGVKWKEIPRAAVSM